MARRIDGRALDETRQPDHRVADEDRDIGRTLAGRRGGTWSGLDRVVDAGQLTAPSIYTYRHGPAGSAARALLTLWT
jgi:hypothetical protein